MALFEPAVEVVLKHEGGFQNKSSDPGNWTSGHVGIGQLKGTNFGISAATFPNEDIQNLTVDRAKQLYESWWVFGPINDQLVANKEMDLSVNWQRYGGHGPSIGVLQQAINLCGGNITVDGALGLMTISAANALDPTSLLNAIRQKAVDRYKLIEAAHPEESWAFAGWEARARE